MTLSSKCRLEKNVIHRATVHTLSPVLYFYRFYKTHGFTQIVDFPSRINNILDVFCTNRPSLINTCYPLPGISDHEIIFVSSFTSVRLNPPTKRKIYLWSKADSSNIQHLLPIGIKPMYSLHAYILPFHLYQ